MFQLILLLDLPCRDQPPLFTPGGWFWYGLENSRYKCPNGFKFENGNYPYWYSNCTIQKTWDPPAVESCVRKYTYLMTVHLTDDL
jgi:hypothetical protein